MALFALSDTHLSTSVDKPMSIFGSRWTDHQNKIELAWNSMVKDEDTVIVGGDISWGIDLNEAKSGRKVKIVHAGRKMLVLARGEAEQKHGDKKDRANNFFHGNLSFIFNFT